MVAGEIIDKSQCESFIKDKIISRKECVKGSSNEGLAKSILNHLNQYPDFIGQINTTTGEKTRFSEFKDLSIRCALWLRKQGIGENDIVCTSTPLQYGDYVPILGTFFVGAIINSWYHELTSAMATYFFSLVEPKIMFASEQSIDMLVAAAKNAKVNCRFVVLGNHPSYESLTNLMAQESQNEIDNFRIAEPKNSKTGGMFFSSGTTGNPKCTMLSYNALLNNRINYLNVYEGMNMLWYSSFSWITGMVFFISCITLRFTRILHPEFDAEKTSSVIEKYKVNWAFITPTMMAGLNHGKVFRTHDFSSLKILISSGSKPNKQTLENTRRALPHCLVANSFGMTESGGFLTVQTKNCKVVDSVGYAVGGVSIKVIDVNSGCKLEYNQPGEICAKVENGMIGYLKNDHETKFMIDKEGWLHTGDLGYYSEDGEIVILDRMKQVIITQNHHVSPSLIEEILLQHPAVIDAAVVPIPHEIDVEVPFAFVIKNPTLNVTPEELIELPTKFNEFYRLSGGVSFIDKIPCTSNGKRNIKELKEKARELR